MGTCENCGKESVHIMNGLCPDCLAEKWGGIVEKSPMVSLQTLFKIEEGA